MPALVRRSGGGGVVVVVALVVSAGYALGAAATTPFTLAANVVTGLAIGVVTVLAVVLWPWRPERVGVLVSEEGPRPRHPYRGWLVLLAVVIGWEVVEYLWRGSRSDHPTLSSMVDALDAHYGAKAVVFFAWLWLGLAIVRAGTPVSSRFRALRSEASSP